MLSQGIFAQAIGTRTQIDRQSYAKISLFEYRHFHAKHVSIEVCYKGDKEYISFVTDIIPDFGDSSNPFKLRNGIPAFFIPSFKDECQLCGFLNHPKIKTKFAKKKRTARENLEIIKDLSLKEKEKLQKLCHPQNVITLFGLDAEKMLRHARQLKENEKISWAPFAGTLNHQPHVYNCASMVMELLYVGGIASLLSGRIKLHGYIGALLGFAYVLAHCPTIINLIYGIIVGFIAGGIIGGACEGFNNIQYFLNVLAREQKDSLSAVLGLRATSIFLHSFLRIFPSTLTQSSILALPAHVFDMAQEAKKQEDAMYLHVNLKDQASDQKVAARVTMS
jgi:hypothetical protein